MAALADHRLRATPEQLRDALGACTQLNGVYRRLLKMALEELKLMEEQMEQLDREASGLLQQHQDAVQRVAEVPGFGVDSAVQMIAEVGPEAAAFESPEELSSWVGVMSGERRERRRVAQHALAEGQQHHAAAAESGSAVSGQGQRQHL